MGVEPVDGSIHPRLAIDEGDTAITVVALSRSAEDPKELEAEIGSRSVQVELADAAGTGAP